jgi:nuclease S1
MKNSIRSLACSVLVLIVFNCYSLPAYAWGVNGHIIVAMIAEQNIDPVTLTQIHQILGDGVSLGDVANFADDDRNDHPERYNFHFVDIPKNKDAYKASRDCKMKPRGDCVLAALLRFRAQILSPNTTPDDRAVALKYIIHLVGDMHQPLHCSDNNDRGGNNVSVSWFGEQTNLHKVWDSRIIDRPQLTNDQFVQGLIDGSNAQEMAEMRNGTMLQWTLESHRLARESAYVIPANGKLSSAYYKRSWPIVDKQLLRGGMRLARVLDWLFAPHSGANTSDPLVLQN